MLYPRSEAIHRNPIEPQKQTSCEEIVKQKYPDAFVDNTGGEWYHIFIRQAVTEPCQTCHQQWTHEVVTCATPIGEDGEYSAWEQAARVLGLI
jgi:hypothetical protein